MKKVKLNIQNFVILFFGILFFSVFLGLYLKNIYLVNSFDYKIMTFVQSNNMFSKSYILFNFVKLITNLGDIKTYFILLIPLSIYFYFNNLKKEFIFLIIVLLFTYFLNEFIKHIVLRKRPVEFFLISVKGYSYPSGHSMIFSSFYLTFIFLLKDKFKNKLFNFFIYILILSVAISRVVLGVHWPSDILIGLILGYFCHLLAKSVYIKLWRD